MENEEWKQVAKARLQSGEMTESEWYSVLSALDDARGDDVGLGDFAVAVQASIDKWGAIPVC